MRTDLPTGTVTFLFTDVEGSTKLLHSLGAEAYKKMWPEMVYPGTIPGQVPVAINFKMADVYASSVDGTDRSITRNDFQFPQEVNLFTAGTLGDKFGFLGELTFEEEAGVSIGRSSRPTPSSAPSTRSTSRWGCSPPTSPTASRKCG